MCDGTCENCKDTKIKGVMSSGRDDMEYRICSHCMNDRDCADDYWCDIGLCVSSDGAAPAETELAPVDVGSGDDILGKWDYSGFHYYFKEDGEISEVEIPELRGTWEYVEGNDYIIYWNNQYEYVDDVTLSEDSNTIEGIRRGREEDIKLTRMD